MSTGLNNLHLLAFICAFKALRRNSIWYRNNKYYKLSGRLNIAPATIKKYFAQCIDLGLIEELETGHYRFIKLSLAIRILLPDCKNYKQNNYVHFFKGFERTANAKTYYDRIRFALAKAQYQKQQYHIDRNKVLDEPGCNRYKAGKVMMSLIKKHGAKSLDHLNRIIHRTKGIVTGKYHLSNIIGCSPSTGSRLLRKWAESGLIVRQVIHRFIKTEVNHYTFDALKAEGIKYIYPNARRTGFGITIGSVVSIQL